MGFSWLEAEEGLDFFPDREGEEEGDEDEPEDEREETDARSLELDLVLDARAPLRAGEREAPLDRERVDGRVFVSFLGSRGRDRRPILAAQALCRKPNRWLDVGFGRP
jgi:hypothetical protein